MHQTLADKTPADSHKYSIRPQGNIPSTITLGLVTGLLVMVVITLSTLGMLGYRLTPPQHGGLCPVAPIRREWRSLTDDEKTEFTEAVKCLATVPSRWMYNGSLYDDFTALHARIGQLSWVTCSPLSCRWLRTFQALR